MSVVMPCDEAAAQRMLVRQRADEDEMRERIYRDERNAFMAGCNECSLKLPRSGSTVYDRVFEDLLYLDNPANWEARRALFNALLSAPLGRQWLADMGERHARDEADSADLSDE